MRNVLIIYFCLSGIFCSGLAFAQQLNVGGGYSHGQIFNDCRQASWCPSMIVVKGGSFVMGSAPNEKGRLDDEGPQHEVFVNAFAVGRFEITVQQYLQCVRQGQCKKPEWLEKGSEFNINTGDDDHYGQLLPSLKARNSPIVGVTWNDAKSYVRWLSRRTGRPYRLLTEAEWEYAAKSGTTTPFWWGARISQEQANYKGTFKLVPVNAFKPNYFGLFNVTGNAGEWVEDCWHDNYNGAPTDGSAWMDGGRGDCQRSVIRGGSWYYSPREPRVHLRRKGFRASRFNNVGFRVARDLQ